LEGGYPLAIEATFRRATSPIHISEELVVVAAIGIDAHGIKHPLALCAGAAEIVPPARRGSLELRPERSEKIGPRHGAQRAQTGAFLGGLGNRAPKLRQEV